MADTERDRLIASRAAVFATIVSDAIDGIEGVLPFILVAYDPDTELLAIESSGLGHDLVQAILIEVAASVNGTDPIRVRTVPGG